MTDSAGVSLWDRTAAEPEPDAVLDGDAMTDVAIVGGGYTGLAAALFCAERGLDVHLLESHRIGHGGSGRNVGLVNAGLWLPPQQVLARLGPERGAALLGELGRMPARVFELIERHGIRCEPVRRGTIHAAHSRRAVADLARRAEGWRALGVRVDLLGAGEMAQHTGTTRFHGGLLDPRAGTVNPMGYARGLARAAQAAGARISTRTSVRSIRRRGEGWLLQTGRGALTARRVALCTNAYTGALWPELRRSFTTIRFFQLATQPLGDRAEGILSDGQGLWDTAPIMFSLRKDAHGRLVVGSMGAILGGSRAEVSRRWAERRLRRLFPGLGDIAFEAAWHGRIAMTPDHLFRIHRLAEGLYAPVGYNGRGITTGTLFGRVLADLFTGAGASALPVPLSDPRPVPFRGLRARFYHTAFAVNQIMGGI